MKPSWQVTKLMLHSGPLPDRAVEVGAAADAAGEAADHPRVAPPEPAHVVAEAAVPLGPAALGERADLIGAGGVPGLGDELGVAEDRILGDALEQGRVRQHAAAAIAAEHRREIEAEAVHVHLDDPVAQASRMRSRTTGCAALIVWPVPVKSR